MLDAPPFTKNKVTRIIESLKNRKTLKTDLVEVCVHKRASAIISDYFLNLFS